MKKYVVPVLIALACAALVVYLNNRGTIRALIPEIKYDPKTGLPLDPSTGKPYEAEKTS